MSAAVAIYTAELRQFTLVKDLLRCEILATARTSDLSAQYIEENKKMEIPIFQAWSK